MNRKLSEQNTNDKLDIKYLKSKVLDDSINAIAIIDLNWDVIYVNKSFLKFWHYHNFKEVIGQNALKFGGDKERSRTILSKIVATGYSIGEHRFKTREGENFMGQMSGTLIKNDENEPIYVLLEFVDITERKLIEQKLMESEEKFRNIASQSLMGIAIVQDGFIKYANETIAQTTGYSAKEMMNWSENEFLKLIHPEDVEFVKEQAKKKQLGEEDVVRNYQFKMITKTGEVRWIENYSQSTLYEGKFADLVTWIDITDRRKAEAKLKESETRYREAFNRTTFYKDLITHDMNNILQVIQLTLDISSLDKNISVALKESLESIKNQVFRGSKLISNVQKLSQLEDSQKVLRNVDIYDVLKDSINFLKKSFTLKKINVKVDTPREDYLVNADNILREVFENILINAVKYNENSTVEIMIKFSEERKIGINYIKLEFMDNGRGIPDSIKKIIFHKGFLEEKQSEGMGIGLTLVKKAIETYNGQIWVEDRITGDYSKGSNFIILIPDAA